MNDALVEHSLPDAQFCNECGLERPSSDEEHEEDFEDAGHDEAEDCSQEMNYGRPVEKYDRPMGRTKRGYEISEGILTDYDEVALINMVSIFFGVSAPTELVTKVLKQHAHLVEAFIAVVLDFDVDRRRYQRRAVLVLEIDV